MTLRFESRRSMIHYLSSPGGLEVLKEALEAAGPENLPMSVVDRLFPAYIPRQKVLVKVFRDGLVEAYGSESVDVRIVLLHRAVTFPEHEIAQEAALDAVLPQPYREIHFPVHEKASALADFDERVA